MDLSTTIASLLPPAVPRDNHLIPLPTRRLVTKPLPPWKTPSSADLPLPVPCPRPPPRRLYSPLNATLLPAADDPVLRHLPDPTTEAKGAGGLSESHCQKFYVHGTADPDWTRAAQSGFPDLVARAILANATTNPITCTFAEVATSTAPALTTFHWRPLPTSLPLALRRSARVLMDLTGPAVHAEALVWRAVARISAAMATLPPEIPLAIRFCNQCDLFYCSHVADSGIPASIGIPAPPPRRPTTSCSHLCWSIDGVHADDGALSRGQVAALAALVSHAQFSVCDAAFCFGIPCSTAFQALFPDELVSTNPRPPPVHHRSSSNRTLSLDPAGFTSSDMQPRPVDLPYHRPCLCATQCTRPGFSCSCTAINHYCNALCSCPATCPRRWPGCKCHRHLATALADQQSTVSDPSSVVAPAVRAGQKRSRSAAATATVIPSPTVGLNGPMVAHMGPCCTDETVCPCAMAKRECGPACAPPAPEPGMADPYGGIAQNMCAQQRVRTAQDKFLDQIFVVQRSRAGDNGHDAGWGLFARTRILRGAFVGEYTGEILSDKEAERRGRAYDDMRFNFMFRLATNATVDGFWCGSLLRFANHGKRGVHANIEAEVVMIDGSQRISMTATRTIDAGQEILLDYGNEYFSFNNTPQKQSS